MSFVRNCLCLNPFISVQGIWMSHLNHPWIHPTYSTTVMSNTATLLWTVTLCSWQTIHSVQIIIIVNVHYTELLRTVPLIIASGHRMESVNNVHVFLLTFYLCSLFQQWMHQDFASQSKCNALVTSSTFRCAFKELFFKIYFTKLFSSVKSTVTVFAALIIIIKKLGFPITSKNWKRFFLWLCQILTLSLFL